ncbi:hypothetical protein [Photobacterium carnosum]|uniref:hypothetical protein n=1 Tax=Photobacterium carnosum TaxID=2023717 RepID=UPI001E4801A3|nr:hypothetical protein [Photobacterium carnosum]MCD9528496.1 hypothetical protein [Photobacterium carnosum]
MKGEYLIDNYLSVGTKPLKQQIETFGINDTFDIKTAILIDNTVVDSDMDNRILTTTPKVDDKFNLQRMIDLNIFMGITNLINEQIAFLFLERLFFFA